MHQYDVTLKLLLQKSADTVLSQTLGGIHISRWLNTELPRTALPRADLVGETDAGGLVHIELQASNSSAMALRMAEYFLGIYRQFNRFPKQLVLYVGDAPMRMPASLEAPGENGPDLSFRYTLVDFRTLDGSTFLNSPNIDDNLLSILGKLRDQRAAIREILSKIADLEEARRGEYFIRFLILSGLRELTETARKEAQHMPILLDLADNEVFGPIIRQSRSEGRSEILHLMLEKRFGQLPPWVEDRFAGLNGAELNDLALRILDARNLSDLFPQ